MKLVYGSMLGALIFASCLGLSPRAGLLAEASAHGAHEHFAAGEPGDPKKPFRIVRVTMLEDGKKMLFERRVDVRRAGAFRDFNEVEPAVVEVRLGEQVRFEIFNEGS